MGFKAWYKFNAVLAKTAIARAQIRLGNWLMKSAFKPPKQ